MLSLAFRGTEINARLPYRRLEVTVESASALFILLSVAISRISAEYSSKGEGCACTFERSRTANREPKNKAVGFIDRYVN